MKKLLTLVMTLALLLSLAACGGSNDAPPENPDTQVSDPGPSQPEDQTPQQQEDPAQDDEPQSSGQPEDGAGSGAPEGDPEDGQQPEDDPTKETQSESQTNDAPAPGSQPEQTPEPPADPDPEPADDPEPAADPKTVAEGLIGRPVSELYAAIGEPLSAEYSPSCLDLDTDDGELTYDGFVVYTEGAPDNETVYDVF